MLIHGKFLKAASAFMAVKDPRYYLTGLFMEVHDSHVVLASTNGHALISVKVGTDPLQAPGSYILPASLIKRVDAKTDSILRFNNDDKTVSLSQAGTTITDKLIDDKYPDFRRIIPETLSGEAATYAPEYTIAGEKAIQLLEGGKRRVTMLHNGEGPGVMQHGSMSYVFICISPLRSSAIGYTKPGW